MCMPPSWSFARRSQTRYVPLSSSHLPSCRGHVFIRMQCLSAQCIYCQSVRAKNTSRQRQHLLECPNYLSAMKEHNPDNPILNESINGTPVQTPAKPPKKRDHDTMIMSGFVGDSSASRSFPIPKPVLERDFQMSVQLNPKISVGPGIWGQRNWVSYISGHWNGRWGKGTVVVGTSVIHTQLDTNNHSLAVKIPSWSLPICPPIWTAISSFKLTTILPPTSR